MTLARKIYKLMEIGKEYRMSDLVEMLYNAEREYMDTVPDIEEALNEEWLEAVHGGNLRQKIQNALKVTREFGYTDVIVTVTAAHDCTGTIRCRGRYGISYTKQKTYHYGEYKDFAYRRIK